MLVSLASLLCAVFGAILEKRNTTLVEKRGGSAGACNGGGEGPIYASNVLDGQRRYICAHNARCITKGTVMNACNAIYSPSGRIVLIMQSDNNLVIYDYRDDMPYRRTGVRAGQQDNSGDSNYQNAAYLNFQTDGNVVIYNSKRGAIWATRTGSDSDHLCHFTKTDNTRKKRTCEVFPLMPKRIIICRHGFRQDWDPVIPENNNSLRSNDNYLSTFGKQQALQLATHLSEIIPKHSKVEILVSPYIRTVETAIPISSALNSPIKLEPLLREHYDIGHQNPTAHFQPLSDIKQYFSALHLSTFDKPLEATHSNISLNLSIDDSYEKLDGPDNLQATKEQVENRVAKFVDGVIDRYGFAASLKKVDSETDEDFTLVLVTHAAIKILLVRAFGVITGLENKSSENPVSQKIIESRQKYWFHRPVQCGVCSCTVMTPVEKTAENGERYLDWSVDYDASYLEGGEMKGWIFPDELSSN
ncbi:hypothetical protein HK098_005803 [Nowakowskiella sp. JEL0407]|nr:hypothetical protein HK098_005803 [Nowakowskiella sp. JEL0407]